jgi:hypothetical protein
MSDEVSYHRKTLSLGILLNRRANVSNPGTGANGSNPSSKHSSVTSTTFSPLGKEYPQKKFGGITVVTLYVGVTSILIMSPSLRIV